MYKVNKITEKNGLNTQGSKMLETSGKAAELLMSKQAAVLRRGMEAQWQMNDSEATCRFSSLRPQRPLVDAQIAFFFVRKHSHLTSLNDPRISK